MTGAVGEGLWTWVTGLMVSLYRGGAEGQRRAVMVLVLAVAPIGSVELALMGRLSAAAFAFRLPLLAAIVGFVYFRKRMTAAEWFVVIAVLPAFVMVQSQWIAGPTYTLLFVVNTLVVVAYVSILFPTWLVSASALAYVTATFVAQLHLRDTGSALALTAAVALACLLVVVFVHGAASYLRHTVAEVEALSAEREVVYRRVQAAADRERVRIAGELHDDAIQALVAGTYQLDGAAGRLAESEPDGRVRGMVVAARDTISGATERIRHLSFDLYPPQLEKDGLEPALGSLAHDAERQYAIKVIVSASPGRVDHAAERLAYRTIKELCTNALKHANARTIRLSAEHDQFAIRGLVEDDGRGYDPAEHQSRRQAGHIGLDATAERVRLADGEFTLVSPPGGGTRASFTIPLAPRGQSVAGG